jgi:hypothetical protein
MRHDLSELLRLPEREEKYEQTSKETGAATFDRGDAGLTHVRFQRCGIAARSRRSMDSWDRRAGSITSGTPGSRRSIVGHRGSTAGASEPEPVPEELW